jgi:hypothetical protein
MQVLNFSPFPVQPLVLLDNNGKETLLVVAKATYVVGDGSARRSEEQEPIRPADRYRGEPGLSSLEWAGETALYKPATDVILLGSAYSCGRNRSIVDVHLSAGRIRKTVRVFGDRQWEGRRPRISEPLPFDRLPLCPERAFGGVDASNEEAPESDARNPVGVGFLARRSRRSPAGTSLPNLEDPANPIRSPMDRPVPAVTGFVAPGWEPRRSLAGTYDSKWKAERAPFLPDDYSPLFQQTAPADQVFPGYMEGGEPVAVQNASPGGRLSFLLPTTRFDVTVRIGEDVLPLAMRLDTVVIDGDSSALRMVWRGSTPVHNSVYDVSWINASASEEA